MRSPLPLALLAFAVGRLTAARAAEPASDGTEEQVVAAELEEIQEDPTIIKPRIWLDTEWNKFKDGSSNIQPTAAELWSWRISSNQDWGVRLKVPLVIHVAGNDPGDSDAQGLGDIKLAAGTAYRVSETWRAGGGLEMRFPSATRDDLGTDVWRLQEFGTIAWDATPWLVLSPTAEYNQSVAREHGGAPQHYLEMYLPATVLLPRRWSVTPRYEAKINFQDDNRWANSGKLTLAKMLDSVPIGFAVSIKKTFDGGDKEFQFNFITTYYFLATRHSHTEAR